MTHEERLADYRRHLQDPVLLAAIAAHGVTPEAVEKPCDDDTSVIIDTTPVINLNARGDLPPVMIKWGFAMARWAGAEPNGLQYETDPTGAINVTTSDTFPDTILTAMAGRPLSDIVTIDGDPGLVVISASTRKLGSFRDTVITLRAA